MDIKTQNLPTIIQAFELQDDNEILIAEQVVNNQFEIDTFKTQYIGKLIKAKINTIEIEGNGNIAYKKQHYLTGVIMFIIILAIIPVAIYEFSKSWIRYYINQFKKVPTESFS